MKNYNISIIIFLFLVIAPVTAYAIDVPCFNGIPCPARGEMTDVKSLIVLVINALLSLAGLVTVLMIIIGGFRYIISGGNEESAEKAKHTIINAIIGIVLIIMSYAIVNSVTKFISNSGTIR